MRCVQFTGQADIFQKPNEACKKIAPSDLEYLKNCQPGVSLIILSCSGGQILVQNLTMCE